MQKQLLIFDFDGCLYPYPENFVDIFHATRIKTGLTISQGSIDEDTALQIGWNSYLETGITYKALCNEFGMSLGEGALLHHRFAKFDLKPNPKLIEAFTALERSSVHCAILTHSTRCNLDHHLPLIGLDRFFPRNLRITIEDHGHDRLKNNSEYPWLLSKWRAEQVSGEKFDDANITVFEDTDKNLIVPADMGWKTVFVHQGAPRIKLLPHIHEQVRCISDFLNKMPQRPQPITAAIPAQEHAAPHTDIDPA